MSNSLLDYQFIDVMQLLVSLVSFSCRLSLVLASNSFLPSQLSNRKRAPHI
jgi:hypothetical protein